MEETLKDGIIKAYYKACELNINKIEKREFGIGFNDKIEQRHLAFTSESELKQFLIERKPRYVSYSVACYAYPDRRPMEKKQLEEIELTFDIDFDDSSALVSKKTQEIAKDETLKLIEDFLFADFGFSNREIELNFSGNRGYHVHVRSDEVKELRQEELKAMSDYISGKNLRINSFFKIEGNTITKGVSTKMLSYPGRIARAFYRICYDKKHFYEVIGGRYTKNNEKLRTRLINAVETGSYMEMTFGGVKEKVEKLFEVARKECSVKIDERVTYDLSKLIRVPESIHGSTGLIAKKLSIEKLHAFRPYDDALVPVKGDLRVAAKEDFLLEANNSTYKFEKTKEYEIPLKVAFFLICKGLCELRGRVITK